MASGSAEAQAAPGSLTDLTVLSPVPNDYKPGRTAWGEPHFRGIWPLDHPNFTPFQRPPEQGNHDAECAARVRQLGATAERFTMTGENSIVYKINYSDPIIFTLPWSARVDWQRDEAYEIFEYACHEGNVRIRNDITSSRAQRAVAGEVSE